MEIKALFPDDPAMPIYFPGYFPKRILFLFVFLHALREVHTVEPSPSDRKKHQRKKGNALKTLNRPTHKISRKAITSFQDPKGDHHPYHPSFYSGLVITFLSCGVLLGIGGALSVAAGWVVWVMIALWVLKRSDSLSGDFMGWSIEGLEGVALFALVLFSMNQ